jgi:hypothetical protein
MSVYYHLYEQLAKIADGYSLSSLIIGFNADLINVLLSNHIDKLRAASDDITMLKMIEDGLSAHVGMKIQVSMFITKDNDRHRLFELLHEWRSAVLAEELATLSI